MLRSGHVEIPAENEKRRVSRRVGWPPVALASRRRTTAIRGLRRRRRNRRANSSPPMRKERSVGRTVARISRPTVASSWSPAAWPSVSLSRLRSSRSIIASEIGCFCRTGSATWRVELLLEGAVVAEAGEGIDARIEGCPIVGHEGLAELHFEADNGADHPADRVGCDVRHGEPGQGKGDDDEQAPGHRGDGDADQGDRARRPESGREEATDGRGGGCRVGRIECIQPRGRARGLRIGGQGRPYIHVRAIEAFATRGRPYPEVPPTAPDRRRRARPPEPATRRACPPARPAP